MGVIGRKLLMREFFKLLLPLLVVLFSDVALAERQGFSATESGDLSLIIVASDSPGYIEEWLQTPPGHAVGVRRLKQTTPDQLIVAAFLVSGLVADARGEYAFSVSFYISDPTGEPIYGV